MVRLRHGARRFARCVMGFVASIAVTSIEACADRRSMTACHPSARAPFVDVDIVGVGGLTALRLAVAMHRDPQLGIVAERVAYRSMAPAKQAAVTEVPTIPVPAPPSEPTGEVATVMAI